MRSMKIVLMVLLSPLLAALLFLGVVHVARAGRAPVAAAPAHTVASPAGAGVREAALAPPVRASRRISIPYGFAPTFPLIANGEQVQVSGHGSCTAGETFAVAVTVTHDASGAMAHGNVAGNCEGEATLQTWQLTAVADVDPLSLGPAESCGLVQTFDGGYVTDEQVWCVDVLLGDYLYLPKLTAP